MITAFSLRRDGISLLDSMIWYVYLLVLIAVSFVNDFYSSRVWLVISGCVYVLCALCVLSAMNGGRCNWQGLADAKYAIVVLSAMVLLLGLQMVVPLERHAEILLLGDSLFSQPSPAWFEPHGSWSIVPEKTRWLFNSELFIFSTFVLSLALICSRRRIKQLLVVLLIVGFTHSVIGIVAKYSELILADSKQLDGHFSAARGWFVNRNHFAAFVSLCLLGPLAFQIKTLMSKSALRLKFWVSDQFFSYKIFYILSLLTGLVALVSSQSRAGFLGLLVSLSLVLFIVGQLGLVQGFRFRRRSLMIPLGVFTAAIMFYFGSELLVRFSSDSLLGERTAQWSVTWGAIKQAWLLGYGGNSYADVFQIHRGYLDFRQVIYNQSHNDYLHIWLEQGLLGLALWLGLLILVMKTACKAIATTSSSLVSATLISTAVVLLAAIIQSTIDFNLQITNIRYYFFVIMSLVFSVPAIWQRKEVSQK